MQYMLVYCWNIEP